MVASYIGGNHISFESIASIENLSWVQMPMSTDLQQNQIEDSVYVIRMPACTAFSSCLFAHMPSLFTHMEGIVVENATSG